MSYIHLIIKKQKKRKIMKKFIMFMLLIVGMVANGICQAKFICTSISHNSGIQSEYVFTPTDAQGEDFIENPELGLYCTDFVGLYTVGESIMVKPTGERVDYKYRLQNYLENLGYDVAVINAKKYGDIAFLRKEIKKQLKTIVQVDKTAIAINTTKDRL